MYLVIMITAILRLYQLITNFLLEQLISKQIEDRFCGYAYAYEQIEFLIERQLD
jgi:hypothetical protein